jgi:hypothetical protein
VHAASRRNIRLVGLTVAAHHTRKVRRA